MKTVIEKIKEIKRGDVGIMIYSNQEQRIVSSLNGELIVPLASASKVAIGFCIAKWVEQGKIQWDNLVHDIRFNPNENSNEVYPHFQQRTSLPLRDAVEVMIACHDSMVAASVVEFCGGWDKINQQIKVYFNQIHVTANPRDLENRGKLSQLLELLRITFDGYQIAPEIWTPVINGLVRQEDSLEGIPHHALNHMTGALEHMIIDIGVLGEFHKYPFLYVLAADHLPHRMEDPSSDQTLMEAIALLYQSYIKI